LEGVDGMTMDAKAIPQVYNGRKFRSRTEARWAHFFHITGTPVEYEPEGYDLGGDKYVPDFLLTHARVFFEVKPHKPTEREKRVARKLAKATGRLVVVAWGNPSPYVTLWAYSPRGTDQEVFLVNEHEAIFAWLHNSTCGDGWSIALRDGLKNPAAYGHQHLWLKEAGDVQFLTHRSDPYRLLNNEYAIRDRSARARNWNWRETAIAKLPADSKTRRITHGR
jgi:hypothetical protein